MAWKDVASGLVWEGAWRDIYVVGTTIADWQRVLDLLNDNTPDARRHSELREEMGLRVVWTDQHWDIGCSEV